MKKLLIAFALFIGLASCSGVKTTVTEDTVEDTVVVSDSVAVDSTLDDSIVVL